MYRIIVDTLSKRDFILIMRCNLIIASVGGHFNVSIFQHSIREFGHKFKQSRPGHYRRPARRVVDAGTGPA